jgi:ribonucleoside-diphosphate reductase alpha chain
VTLYNFNIIAQNLLESDYLLAGGETPVGMLQRVATKIASAEQTEAKKNKWAKIFFESLSSGDWICATPFLMNSGVNDMFASCFVVGPLDDDLHSIFTINERVANVTKMGGGVGINVSNLRETGAMVKSTRGHSTGPVSFMQVFNTTLDVVMQARRRGAGIIVMSIYHPDIEEFITCKQKHNNINNYNLSVIVDDNFMSAVKDDKEIELVSPLGYVVRTVSARELFKKVTDNAFLHAEPGILFKSAINQGNPCLDTMGEIDSVNACGEIPLYNNEACNLSAINLQNFVDDRGTFDEERLINTVGIIVRFLDDSIDINNYPDDQIRNAVLRTRKLGIGVLGLHGFLIKMGFTYDSERGRALAAGAMALINSAATQASQELVKEGRPVPAAWYGSTYETDKIPIRNLSVTSGQPTGATQILLDTICCSSGIEPIFSLTYVRNVRGQKFNMVNSLFEKIGKDEGWLTEEVIKKISGNHGSCQGIEEVPQKWQALFKTSHEIAWQDHVAMQSSLQKHTTNALSKTINMPPNSKPEDVYAAYMMAWQNGCKGCTVYVSGSRDGEVLSTTKTEEPAKEKQQYVPVSPVLKIANAKRVKIKTGCGSMWVTLVSDDDGNLREIFSQSGSTGGCKGMTECLSRIISTALRANVDPMAVVDQLKSVSCDVSKEARKKDASIGKSCGDGIATQMVKFIKGELDGKISAKQRPQLKKEAKAEESAKFQCPECKEFTLLKYDGCIQCESCGWQRCI